MSGGWDSERSRWRASWTWRCCLEGRLWRMQPDPAAAGSTDAIDLAVEDVVVPAPTLPSQGHCSLLSFRRNERRFIFVCVDWSSQRRLGCDHRRNGLRAPEAAGVGARMLQMRTCWRILPMKIAA